MNTNTSDRQQAGTWLVRTSCDASTGFAEFGQSYLACEDAGGKVYAAFGTALDDTKRAIYNGW